MRKVLISHVLAQFAVQRKSVKQFGKSISSIWEETEFLFEF